MTGSVLISGARNHYGPRFTETKAPSAPSTYGEVNELVVPFNYADLPSVAAEDAVVAVIPANSFVLSAHLYLSEALDSTSGTTTVDVGTALANGTPVDADGLFVDLADGAVGWVVGGGAQVGASVGAADVYVTATPSVADLVAGAGKVVIRYLKA